MEMQHQRRRNSYPREEEAGVTAADAETAPRGWDDRAFRRVKLMCSYGGRILPRPHDHQLRYVGGHTHLVVVPRSITYADLAAKLAKTFAVGPATETSLFIKYQLPTEDLDTLISVTCDEDLHNMMDEHDRLDSSAVASGAASASGRIPRLRLFLFPVCTLQRSYTAVGFPDYAAAVDSWFADQPPMSVSGSIGGPSASTSATPVWSSSSPDYLTFGTLEEWAAATSVAAVAPSTAGSEASFIDEDINLCDGDRRPESGEETDAGDAAQALFGSLLQLHHLRLSGDGTNSPASSSAPNSPIAAKQHHAGFHAAGHDRRRQIRRQPMPFPMSKFSSSSSAPPSVLSAISAAAARAAAARVQAAS